MSRDCQVRDDAGEAGRKRLSRDIGRTSRGLTPSIHMFSAKSYFLKLVSELFPIFLHS